MAEVLFDPYIVLYQVLQIRVTVDLRVIATKVYSTLLRAPGLDESMFQCHLKGKATEIYYFEKKSKHSKDIDNYLLFTTKLNRTKTKA